MIYLFLTVFLTFALLVAQHRLLVAVHASARHSSVVAGEVT